MNGGCKIVLLYEWLGVNKVWFLLEMVYILDFIFIWILVIVR